MAKQPIVLLITCRKYQDLIRECTKRIDDYAHFLIPVQILITRDNVHEWTDSVRQTVEKLDNDMITVLLDDYYLTASCLSQSYQFAVNCMGDPDVKKFDLSTDRTRFPHVDITETVIMSTQTARYRSSLQAAIWRKDYLMKLLVPGRTPWEFELEGEKECVEDGAVILGTRTGILEYDNVMLKGARVK